MESELVSGFMTEHSAVIFVFFFLAEYASIVLICILTIILFLGGYILLPMCFSQPIEVIDLFSTILWNLHEININSTYTDILESFFSDILDFIFLLPNSINEINWYKEELIPAFILGIKTGFMIFLFIWVRASFPRVRFDELMSYCWTKLLPVLVAIIILVPFIEYGFDIIPHNISVL